MKKPPGIFVLLFLWPAFPSFGQDSISPQQNYLEESIQPKKFDAATWEKTTEGLSYTLRPRENSRKKTNSDENRGGGRDRNNRLRWGSGDAGPLMRVLLLLFLVVVVAFIVRALIRNPKNKKIRQAKLAILLDKLEEDLPGSNLEQLLVQALKNSDFALAIRIYYLQVLQELLHLKRIHWKKEKTNRDYLREMKDNAFFPAFEQATRIFEKVRYGAYSPGSLEFPELQLRFQHLLSSLRAENKGTPAGKSPARTNFPDPGKTEKPPL